MIKRVLWPSTFLIGKVVMLLGFAASIYFLASASENLELFLGLTGISILAMAVGGILVETSEKHQINNQHSKDS